MKVNCPHCSQPLEVPPELAGQTIPCPACQGMLSLPAATVVAVAPLSRAGLSVGWIVGLTAVIVGLAAMVIGLLVVRKGSAPATAAPVAAAVDPQRAGEVAAKVPQPARQDPSAPTAPADERDFTPIFNGRDLTGWSGAPGVWKVENGSLVGAQPPDAPTKSRCQIHWSGGVAVDFELRFAFKVPVGASGLVYRSQDFGEWERFGYEFVLTDQKKPGGAIGQVFESGVQGSRPAWVPGRGHLGTPGTKVRVEANRRIIPDGTSQATMAQAIRAVKPEAWNEGVILAQGTRLTHLVNGVVITEVDDQAVEPARLSGAIGFKLSPGSRVELKDIRIRKLGAGVSDHAASGTAVAASLAADAEPSGPIPYQIQWQQTFGGRSNDVCTSIQPAPDGGYLLAGASSSPISGNKSSTAYGSEDWWIVRIDSEGKKLWEKTFGGSGKDWLRRATATRDGGFILCGRSDSPPSGDKTSPEFGKGDGWLVRIDPQGAKLWEKAFGGSDWDNINDVRETTDGGFILAMRSASPISGSKTAPNFGSHDGVVVRLDASGEKVWEQSYGGGGEDGFERIRELQSGHFIVAGYIGSTTTSGNITVPSAGGTDYWVLELDQTGNRLWERVFGGDKLELLFDVDLTSAGQILVGGNSVSPPGFNKTGPAYGKSDFWAVLLDRDGSKLWDHSYGGIGWDGLSAIASVKAGYVLAGSSESSPSGNKSTANRGVNDYWLLGISPEGKKLWEQSLGGSSTDNLTCLLPTSDGGFIVAGSSESPADGSKSVPNYGGSDAWVMKLAPKK